MEESSDDESFQMSKYLVSEKEEKEEEAAEDTEEDAEESEEEEESDEEDEEEEEDDEPEEQAPEVVAVPPPDEKKEGEEDLEFDDAESPDKEEAYNAAEDDVQLPPHFLVGKADKLRRKSAAIRMKLHTRLEKLKSAKHRPAGKSDGREQEEKHKEQEIIHEALLEWKLECHDKIQKYKDKISKARTMYKRRYEKQQKKIEIHVRKSNQSTFMQNFSPKDYHRNMANVADKKRKPLDKIT